MSAEAIIQQIHKDAEKGINEIEKETKEKINKINAHIQKETEEMKQQMLDKGEQEARNIRKIEISKTNQEAKRKQMQTKEKLIDTCFQNAIQKLKELDDGHYEKIIENLIKKGRVQINDTFYIQSSKPLDKKIAEKQNITVKGTIDASGGIRLISEKGTITIDNTFEGILTRKKQDIRVHVGNMLFP